MKIAVRLDDITPDMDWKRFYAFKALLDKYQVKPLIGIVPRNRDENLKGTQEGAPEDFWEYVRQLKEEGWSIALHGCRHIYTTGKSGVFPLNDFSEFAGVPYEKQKEMLAEGKAVLEENGLYKSDGRLRKQTLQMERACVLSHFLSAWQNIAEKRWIFHHGSPYGNGERGGTCPL